MVGARASCTAPHSITDCLVRKGLERSSRLEAREEDCRPLREGGQPLGELRSRHEIGCLAPRWMHPSKLSELGCSNREDQGNQKQLGVG